jgi:hypothetical protein
MKSLVLVHGGFVDGSAGKAFTKSSRATDTKVSAFRIRRLVWVMAGHDVRAE